MPGYPARCRPASTPTSSSKDQRMKRLPATDRLLHRAGAALLSASSSIWFVYLAGAVLALALSACGGGSGSSGSAATVQANATATPVVSISATPTATTIGQVVTLTWSVSNPASTS